MKTIADRNTRRIIFYLSLVLFALSFLVTHEYAFNWDLTQNQRNTLSPTTHEILSSLKDNVIINYYYSPAIKNLDFFPVQIDNFLQVYASASPRLIYRQWEEGMVNYPLSQIGLESHGITVRDSGQPKTLTFYSGIEIIYAGKRALIPFIDRTEDLEYTLTTALERIIHPFEGRIGLSLQEREDTAINGFKGLMAVLGSYNPQEVLLNDSLDPMDTPLLIVIGSELLNDARVLALESYVAKGGSLLLSAGGTNLDVLRSGGAVLSLENTPLMEWLGELGIKIEPDLVLDPLGATPVNAGSQIVSYPAIITLASSDLNRENPLINGLTRLVAGWFSSLSWEEKESTQVDLLFSSSPEGLAWREGINADPFHTDKWLNDQRDQGDQIEKAYPLSIAVRLVPEEDSPLGMDNERRMILVGSRYAFHDALIPFGGQNLDFLVRSVDWLLKRDYLNALKKEPVITLWNFKTASERLATHEWVLFTNAFALPLVVLAGGVFYLSRRKRRSEKGESQ
jgi:ABC-type uncharacterized transport system involved in gliding motility auxiliary subunit